MSATIPTQTIPQAGHVIGNQQCLDGDTVATGTLLIFRNTGGSTRQVTIAVPGTDRFSNPLPDLVFDVVSGQMYGVRCGSEFKDPEDQLAHLAYDDTGNLTVRALSV